MTQGGGYPLSDPVIGNRMLTAEAGRREGQPIEAGVELGIPGDELCKPVRILVGVGGGRGGIRGSADLDRRACLRSLKTLKS
jgi:hypothetical protein